MQPPQLYLVDRNPQLVAAWKEAFSDFDNVSAYEDDFFARDASAMVSPANSFGIMDGGLDRAIRDQLGFEVERNAQEMILEKFHGEMPIATTKDGSGGG